MGRLAKNAITYRDAQIMEVEESYIALKEIPLTNDCMTRSKIEEYLKVNKTTEFMGYAPNELVPYENIVPSREPELVEPSVENVNSISATFTWPESKNAAGYNIKYRKVGESNWLGKVTNNTSQFVDNLSPNITYEYYLVVRSTISTYNLNSSVYQFTTTAEIPEPPIVVIGNFIDYSKVESSWEPVENAQGYRMETYFSSDDSLLASFSTSNTELELPHPSYSLAEGDEYYVIGYSFNDVGTSSPSDRVYFKVPNNPLTPAKPVIQGDPSYDSILVTWGADPTTDTYTLRYRKDLPGEAWKSFNPGFTGTQLTLDNLEEDTVYELRLTAYNSEGFNFSDSIFVKTFTQIAVTDPPAKITVNVTNITDNEATINWGLVADPVKYNIEIFKVSDDTRATARYNISNDESVAGSWVAERLDDETQYYVKAVSKNVAARVEADIVYFTTLADQTPPPDKPIITTEVPIGASYVNVIWADVANADSYDIAAILDGNNFRWLNEVSPFKINAGYGNTVYSIRVIARNDYGYTKSDAKTVTIPQRNEFPSKPNISISDITTHSFNVDWGVTAYTDSYIIKYRKLGDAAWISHSLTETTYKVNILESETQYEVKVEAHNAYNINSSDIKTATTEVELQVVPCSESVDYSGEMGDYSYDIEFGTGIGKAGILYNAYGIPDKFTLIWGDMVISTGYVGSARNDDDLIAAGIDPSEINTSSEGNGNGKGVLSFNKNTALPTKAKIIVTAPLHSTAWNVMGLCPGFVADLPRVNNFNVSDTATDFTISWNIENPDSVDTLRLKVSGISGYITTDIFNTEIAVSESSFTFQKDDAYMGYAFTLEATNSVMGTVQLDNNLQDKMVLLNPETEEMAGIKTSHSAFVHCKETDTITIDLPETWMTGEVMRERLSLGDLFPYLRIGISLQENDTNADRQGVITVSNQNGETDSFTLIQKA